MFLFKVLLISVFILSFGCFEALLLQSLVETLEFPLSLKKFFMLGISFLLYRLMYF